MQHHGIIKQQADKMSQMAAAAEFSPHIVSIRVDDEDSDQGGGNCIGSCCGNGLGCCGAVMVSAQQTLPDFAHQSAIAPLDFDYGTGIDPDALKRPPRTIA
jgi:hypothetical protein